MQKPDLNDIEISNEPLSILEHKVFGDLRTNILMGIAASNLIKEFAIVADGTDIIIQTATVGAQRFPSRIFWNDSANILIGVRVNKEWLVMAFGSDRWRTLSFAKSLRPESQKPNIVQVPQPQDYQPQKQVA